MKRAVRSGASPLKKSSESIQNGGINNFRWRLPEPLSKEEQRKIWMEVEGIRRALRKVKAGSKEQLKLTHRYEQLRNQMVETNLLFIEARISKYLRRVSYSLEADDLKQEARLALFEAFDRYRRSRRKAFLTYAGWWIDNRIFLAAADRFLVKMPDYMQRAMRKSNRLLKQMVAEKEGGRVNIEEIAKKMGISARKLERIRQRAVREFISFDLPTSESDDRLLSDKLASAGASVEDLLASESVRPIVQKALSFLDERQALVIRTRFGIGNGGEEKSLKRVGQELGMLRQNVWNVEKSALKKLRAIFTRRIFVGGEKEIRTQLE